MSAEIPPAPASKPVLTLESKLVATLRPGLARLLGGLALAQALVPLLALVMVYYIADHMGGAGRSFRHVASLAYHAFGYGTVLSLLTALLSAVVGGTELGRHGPAVVAAGRDGLRVAPAGRAGKERWIPRKEIKGGLLVPAMMQRVQLQLTGDRVLEVEVPSEELGARLLAALGIGPEERRVSVQLGDPNTQTAAGCVALPGAIIGWTVVIFLLSGLLRGIELPFWIAAVSLTVLLVRRLTRPTEVVVGSDGVRVKKPFSTRWVPYTELDSVAAEERQIVLGTKDGTHVPVSAHRELGDALAQRIREAQARRAAAGVHARGAAALERQGRPIAAWREGLRGLLDQVGGYRASALTAEDVIEVLESPEAPRERRIGAALALAEAGHPEARARIRVAAEASADEELRAALEQAAEEEMDEAAVERALQER